MPTLDANGITINYRFDGDDDSGSDLVVLINGLADDLETWSYQVPALLKTGYRVLRYDNRGIGATSRPLGPYTAELLADDLQALLKKLGVGHFHLLGVSMGGMIAQAYALKYPNGADSPQHLDSGPRLLSLGLCCTYAQPTTFCERMFSLWAEMAERMSIQDVMRDVTLWAFTVSFFRTRKAELEEVEEAMAKLDMGLEAYLAQLNVIQQFDSTKALGRLRAEEGKVLGGLKVGQVLVLAGEVDILIPVILSKELADGIKGARFTTVKGGHACMWEFPDDFNEAMINFLDTANGHHSR